MINPEDLRWLIECHTAAAMGNHRVETTIGQIIHPGCRGIVFVKRNFFSLIVKMVHELSSLLHNPVPLSQTFLCNAVINHPLTRGHFHAPLPFCLLPSPDLIFFRWQSAIRQAASEVPPYTPLHLPVPFWSHIVQNVHQNHRRET